MATIDDAVQCLKKWDNIMVLSHASPDGDTLGSATALIRALMQLKKNVCFMCADVIGNKYSYLFDGLPKNQFDADYIVSVDIADPQLLGNLYATLGKKVDLAIDHHGTHVPFGKMEVVDSTAAANCQIIYQLIGALGVKIDAKIADCLYTGISTDTGCFQYSNTSAKTHRIAAGLIELGANSAEINRIMFDTKTKSCIEVEREVLKNMEFFHNDKIAAIYLPLSLVEKTGAKESDLEGLPSIPRSIEGVLIGITMKEKEGGIWKASVRAKPPVDASAICQTFGGGGHKGAAGCSFDVTLEEAKKMLVAQCEKHLNERNKP